MVESSRPKSFVAQCLCAILLFLANFAFCGDDAGGLRLQRAAVIGDAKIADLVTVKLSQSKLELLERGQIEKIMKEKEFINLCDAGGIADRLEIGRMLDADALIILSQDAIGAKPVVKLVICECRQGARLAVHLIPNENSDLEKVAGLISEKVEQAVSKYSGQRLRLVAVPPFLSKNLTHDYDRMQSIYACLLANVLSAYPGVATLEIEEARSIQQELAGKDLDAGRQVPCFVEGTFRMDKESKDSPVQVAFEVDVSTAGDKEKVNSGKIPLDVAHKWLTEGLAAMIMRQKAVKSSLPVEEQTKHFLSKADEFHSVGAMWQAADLREAYLLLYPQNAKQRLLLISEYRSEMNPYITGVTRENIKNPSNQLLEYYRANIVKAVDAYRMNLTHLEYLVRNRLIKREDALRLYRADITGVGCSTPDHLFNMMPHLKDPRFRIIQQEGGRNTEILEEDFIFNVAPHILELPTEYKSKDEIIDLNSSWHDVSIKKLIHRADRDEYILDKGILDKIWQFLIKDTPNELSVSAEMSEFIENILRPLGEGEKGDYYAWEHATDITDSFFRGRFEELMAANNKVLKIYGRFGLFLMKAYKLNKETSKTEIQMAIDELDSIINDYKKLNTSDAKEYSPREEYERCFAGILNNKRRYLQGLIEPPKPKPSASVSKNPTPSAVSSPSLVTYEKIDLRLDNDDKNKSSTSRICISNIINCDEQFEIYSNGSQIYVMHEKDVLKKIVDVSPDSFRSLVWDGRHIWAGLEKAGINIFDSNGTMVSVLDSNSIPPFEKGLLLHAIGEGRILAVGSFGKYSRSWIAIIDVNKDILNPEVNVISECTRRPDYNIDAVFSHGIETDVVYEPVNIIPYSPYGQKAAATPFLLVNRDRCYPHKYFPLIVGIDSLKVSAYPEAVSPEFTNITWNGLLFTFNSSNVGLFINAPRGKRWINNSKRLNYNKNVYHPLETIFCSQGWLYVSGVCPRRIKLDCLYEEILDYNLHSKIYLLGFSKFYGLLGQEGGKLYKATIKDELTRCPSLTQQQSDMFFRFMLKDDFKTILNSRMKLKLDEHIQKAREKYAEDLSSGKIDEAFIRALDKYKNAKREDIYKAYSELIRVSDRRSVAPLISLLGETTNKDVKRYIAAALGTLGNQKKCGDDNSYIVDILCILLFDDDAAGEAAKALGKM